MKRPIQLGLLLLCLGLAVGESSMQAASQTSSKRPNTSNKRAVLLEDALIAFFEPLDQSSKTVVANPHDPDLLLPELPDELVQLRVRMMQRMPQLDSVRKRGTAGEGNRGYLELRGSQSREDQTVVAEENTDRLAAYELLAALTKTDVNDVGRLRAQKAALGARRSVWVQGKDGNWYQKT